jgi:branched-subunit amino acid transport protein
MNAFDTVDIWLSIASLTLVTLLMRGAFLFFGASLALPVKILRGLHYAPAGILVALVAPSALLDSSGQWAIYPQNYALFALLAAGVYFWFFRHMLGMVVLGVAVFALLRLGFSA